MSSVSSIELNDIGKKFGAEWIFRHIEAKFEVNEAYALVGNNGSGKSTLIKLIAGYTAASEGKIIYRDKAQKCISAKDYFKHLSWAAPYTELIEELTLDEMLDFHQNFEPMRLTKAEILEKLSFKQFLQRPIRFFSSGMKQKLKLALTIYSQSSILMLDEPTSNLDKANIKWYENEILEALQGKIVLIASNQPKEYKFCSKKIDISNHKL
ncbi:MAG: ATP-binding cassette domain-containing protein [Bernardetiaceae bacterium]|nr:ATP-binding cassette domain-containing protein [Bernardetiaceae bacterium]